MSKVFKAKKANVVLQIKEEAVDRYLSKGFSIYGEDDKLVAKAAPQSLVEFQEENKALKEKIAELENKLAKLSQKTVDKKNDKKDKEPKK